ncbi:MAG: sigma-70 family RNA polymerase sigma factor [Planctomycetota bacterium]
MILEDRKPHCDDTSVERAMLGYRDRVFAVCRRRLRCTADAEDATQETLRRYLESVASIHGPHERWLVRCARNVCVDHVRRQSRRRRREQTRATSESVHDPSLVVMEARELTRFLLGRLSGEEQELIRRHVIEGVPQSVLAAERGVSQQMVSKRLRAATGKLRVWVKEHAATLSIGGFTAGVHAWASRAAMAICAWWQRLPPPAYWDGMVNKAVPAASTVGLALFVPASEPVRSTPSVSADPPLVGFVDPDARWTQAPPRIDTRGTLSTLRPVLPAVHSPTLRHPHTMRDRRGRVSPVTANRSMEPVSAPVRLVTLESPSMSPGYAERSEFSDLLVAEPTKSRPSVSRQLSNVQATRGVVPGPNDRSVFATLRPGEGRNFGLDTRPPAPVAKRLTSLIHARRASSVQANLDVPRMVSFTITAPAARSLHTGLIRSALDRKSEGRLFDTPGFEIGHSDTISFAGFASPAMMFADTTGIALEAVASGRGEPARTLSELIFATEAEPFSPAGIRSLVLAGVEADELATIRSVLDGRLLESSRSAVSVAIAAELFDREDLIGQRVAGVEVLPLTAVARFLAASRTSAFDASMVQFSLDAVPVTSQRPTVDEWVRFDASRFRPVALPEPSLGLVMLTSLVLMRRGRGGARRALA